MGNVCIGELSNCMCVLCRTKADSSARPATHGVTEVQHLGGNLGKRNVARGREKKRPFTEEPPSPVAMPGNDSDSE